MNTNKFIRILSLFLIIITVILAAGCSKTGSLKNTGFDEGKVDKVDNWEIFDYHRQYNNDTTRTSIGIVSGGIDGNCVQIKSNEKNDARVHQTISVKKNQLYKISVYVKTENVEAGKGANISAIEGNETSESVYGNTDWKELVVYGRTGKKQKKLDLSLGLGSYSAESIGTAYFDKLSIEEVSRAPEGASVISMEPYKNNNDKKKTEASPLMKALFASAIIGLILYSVLLCIKADKEHHENRIPLSYELPKRGKTDLIIILTMTIIASAISFFRLGDLKAASNYWKASKRGEYIIVEFEDTKDVTRIAFSCGVPSAGIYIVSYENEPDKFKEVLTIKDEPFFEWQTETHKFTTKRVKIEATTASLPLNEIGFFETDKDGNYNLLKVKIVTRHVNDVKGFGKPENLFDEQDTVPVKASYMNGTYFDEVYFPRTAYEHIHGLEVYETTHPPLGKDFMALGIKIFGMNPFGWRFMGTLAGVLLVPIMYLFGLKLFKKRLYAFASAFLMMFDFMRMSQTRLATIDSYSCLFVLLMYYFMYDYFVVKSYDLRYKRSLRPLIFSGIAFGLGAASKWTSLYAGAGIAILFFLAKYAEADDYAAGRVSGSEKKNTWLIKNFLPTCLWCVLLFVVIPGTIYVLSYIPYMAPEPGKGLLKIVYDNQLSMYSYHSGLTSSHGFGSKWFTWPIMLMPMWFYKYGGAEPGMWGTITTMGNPAIWWIGIFALVYSVYVAWKKRDKFMIPIFVGYGLQYFPWILVTRVAFIYHYFTAVPFMIFMIVYSIKNLIEEKIITKKALWVYLAIVFILFVIFYPVLTGMVVKQSYVESLRWFSKWYF